MNKEIKEILDNVKKCCDITKDQSFIVYQRHDILALLDYITNLQEERDFYKCTDSMNTESCIELLYRIDKAIKYIENHRKAVDERNEKIIYWLTDDFDEEDILNILKGSE